MIDAFCIRNCYEDANLITVDAIIGDEKKSILCRLSLPHTKQRMDLMFYEMVPVNF